MEEVAEVCHQMLREAQDKFYSTELICVYFSGQKADNASLSYTLAYNVPRKVFFPTEAHLDVVSYLAKYRDDSAEASAYSVQLGVIDRVVSAQKIIDSAYMKLHSKNESMPYQVLHREMPMAPPFLDVKAYRNAFFFALSIAFCLPLIFRLGDVTSEISSGLLEHQHLMGLSLLQFWLGHFMAALILGLVEGGLVLCVTYFSVKDFAAPKEHTTASTDYNRRVRHHAPFIHGMNEPWSGLQGLDYRGDEGKVPEYERVSRDFLDVPYLGHLDASLVVVAFFLFHVCHTLLGLLIACVMPLGRWAVLLGFGVFLLLPCYDRASFSFFDPIRLSSYLGEDRITKLRRCIYPNAAMDTVMKIIGIFNDFELNAGWNVVAQQALGCDNVTILEVWGVMGATALAAVVLIWYLSHVLPWTSATPQSPLFPLLPWYWMPWRVQLSKDETATALNAERFEPPPDAPAVIECRGLKKYFGNFAALSGVDMTIHRHQVTVLLGHNGAGKTTLFSIMTGLYTPSGGKVTVAGYGVHTDAARGMVGYCPQVDVFFDDLTVQEHVVYYAGLRGVDNPIRKANKIMHTLRLKDKAESLPHQLSGGYKRKLSVAIALVSSPKLLILDEPTSGMDPEIRESFWKIINHLRGKVTILLSTHDMEEADAVGDRIIVMHSGRVICSGSPTFLKNACGVGYKLTIGKAATGFKLDQVLDILRRPAPLAVVERERDHDVTFALHTFNCDGFEDMFRTLESYAPMLGVTGISVAVATMNDAYVL
ncbi:phospholipid-transporting ATPase ABCA3-like [Haemaphysalis longicornis]